MMEAAFRPAPTGARPDWVEPFTRTINAAKKYVVSSNPGPGGLERGDGTRGSRNGDSNPASLGSVSAAIPEFGPADCERCACRLHNCLLRQLFARLLAHHI